MNQVHPEYKQLICRIFPNKKGVNALCRQGLVYTLHTLHFACKLRSGYGSIPGIFQLSFPPQTQRPAAGMLSFALSMKYYTTSTIAWRKRVAGQWPCLAGHEALHDGPMCGGEIAWRPLWPCCHERKIFSPLNPFGQRQHIKRRSWYRYLYLYQYVSIRVHTCSLRMHWLKLKLDNCPLAVANTVM